METLFIAVYIVAVVEAIPLDQFYPYMLEANRQLYANDDASSLDIDLSPPVIFYNRGYDSCKIHNNGIVAFGTPPEHFMQEPLPLSNYTFIAPFYGDVDTRKAGTVWFTDPATTDLDMLNRAAHDINSAFKENGDFKPSYLVIATWDHVGYFKERHDKVNTFQCIIASDGRISFAIFLYNETQWTATDDLSTTPSYAKIGFNTGNELLSWEVPCSMSPSVAEVTSTSNTGIPGRWIFRLSGRINSACPDDENHCVTDPLCSCLTSDPDQNCQCNNTGKYMKDCLYLPPEDMPSISIPSQASGSSSMQTMSEILLLIATTFCLMSLWCLLQLQKSFI